MVSVVCAAIVLLLQLTSVAGILQNPVFLTEDCKLVVQCFASWLSMCKVEMALINISSSN